MSETTISPTNSTAVVTDSVNNNTTTPSISSTSTSAASSSSSTTTTTTTTTTATATTTTKVPTTTIKPVYCPAIDIPYGWPSNSDRSPGASVRLRCGTGAHLTGPSVLLCQNNGSWNGTVPTCDATIQGLPLSTKLFIGVLTGCCGLVLLVVLIILCKLWFCTNKKEISRYSDRHHRLPRNSADSLPPAPNPVQYHTHERRYNVYHDTGGGGVAGDRNSVTYAKPEIYSTFINPTFYEDVYERWRRRESEDQYAAEALYDSPWQHSKRPEPGDGSELRWSTLSLSAHDNYDYGRFGKIPRSHVSEPSEADDITPL